MKPPENAASKRKIALKKTSLKSSLSKRGDFNIDLESFFRNKIESLLIVSSWSERFRAEVGLKGVSQVWGLRPAWYLWIENAPGVFHLELIDTQEAAVNGTDLCKAIFTLKCYPYADGDRFQSFSFLEKKLIQSHFFDKTNTPAFEYQEKIPPDLYTVARLELTTDHEGHAALFFLETLDILRSRYARKTDQAFSIVNLSQQFDKGEIDRNIQGLEISYPLFDCILCLYANAQKQVPLQIQCSKLPGFEIVIGHGNVDVQRSDRIAGYKMGVLYAESDISQALDLINMQKGLIEPREDVFYDRMFQCSHYHSDRAEKRLPITINKQWWTLAHTQFQSDLASTCGCH